MLKKCNRCLNLLDELGFSKHPNGRDGRHPTCNKCRSEEFKIRYAENRDKILATQKAWRKRNPQSPYGISKEEYDRLIASHNGICAICERERKLVIDHCHKTGVVRGMLCNSCNTSLGKFQEDPCILERAVLYLRKINSAGPRTDC